MIIHREYESQLANMRQEYEARIKRVNDAKFRMIQKHEDEITAINIKSEFMLENQAIEHMKAINELSKQNAANEKRLQKELRDKDVLFDNTFTEFAMEQFTLQETIEKNEKVIVKLEEMLIEARYSGRTDVRGDDEIQQQFQNEKNQLDEQIVEKDNAIVDLQAHIEELQSELNRVRDEQVFVAPLEKESKRLQQLMKQVEDLADKNRDMHAEIEKKGEKEFNLSEEIKKLQNIIATYTNLTKVDHNYEFEGSAFFNN